MKRTALLTLVGLAGGWASFLQADVIYNDFYTGTPTDSVHTAFVTNAGASVSGFSPSFEFSPTVSEALGEVDFVTSIQNSQDLNQIIVSVSTTPGDAANVLASQEFDNAMGVLGTSSQVIAWQPVDVNLIANQNYWITLDAPGSDVTWNANDLTFYGGQPQFGYDTLQSGSWQPFDGTLGAIEIQGGTLESGSSTPEPGTLILLSSGFLGCLAIRRRLAASRWRNRSMPES